MSATSELDNPGKTSYNIKTNNHTDILSMSTTTYQLWIRINPTQTAYVLVQATTALQALGLGESMYGPGAVLNYTEYNNNSNNSNG